MAPPPPHPASPAIIIALSHPRLSLPDMIMPPVEFGGAESCAWSFGWRRNAQRAFSWRRGEQERERAPLGFLVASTPRGSWLAAPLLLSPQPHLSPSHLSLLSLSFLFLLTSLPPSSFPTHPTSTTAPKVLRDLLLPAPAVGRRHRQAGRLRHPQRLGPGARVR